MIRNALRHPMVDVAVNALGRNRLQTGLTMLGITVGVATRVGFAAWAATTSNQANFNAQAIFLR